jgi:dienelactone hydrolase
MTEIEITHVDIHRPSGEALPNCFFRQAGEASELALVLPGLNYTADMPLLYYPARLLVERGADVLQVQADYTRPDFQSLDRMEQMRWLGNDAQAALKAGQSQRDYRRLILIGKSIGTLTLAYLVSLGGYAQATTIWLTPLLRQPWLVEAALQCRGRALFIAGTGDRTYDSEALQRIQDATGARTLLLPGANHSLEITGDLQQSLKFMQEIVQTIGDFL